MLRLLLALLGYVALAVTLTWPLARDVRNQLPGDPAGDTGVYVWNLWIVAHELRGGRSPLSTELIFAATGTADLSQHNATLAPAVLAAPLVEPLGVVATFNIVYLGLLAACGLGVYVLSAYLTRRAPESWVAGALTMASPCVLARSTEHLSLLALGIVPVFAYAWVRMLDSRSVASALASGVAMAVAAYCDPYLAIYCTLVAALLLVARIAHVTIARRPFFGFGGQMRILLDGLLVALALVVVSILASGGWTATVLGVRIVAHTLYTPVLAMTLLSTVRVAWWLRPRIEARADASLPRFAWLGTIGVVTGVLCLSPWLAALVRRMQSGRLTSPDIHWRSSPPGVDLAAFVAPSPMHAIWGPSVREWLERLHPAGFAEYTPSLSLTAVLVIAAALLMGLRLPGRWLFVTLASAACALGPFVHVAGVNTFIPGPWALLRYVPVIEWARSPSRFALIVTIGVGVLCAHALVGLRDRFGHRARRALLAGVVVLGVIEFWPAPPTLHAVHVPSIFSIVAADPDPAATVLELPVGMRDGTSSMGNFSARTQFHQAWHGKRLIGGYVSRISERRKDAARKMPILSAMIALSERQPIDDAQRRRALTRADTFIERTGLRYIVIDVKRCPPELREFADALFSLEWLGEDQGYVLYRVTRGRFPDATSAELHPAVPVLP